MLDLWCSHRTVFVETKSSRRIFSSALTCTAVVVWFFVTVLHNVRRSLSVSVEFRPLFLFADVVFPWFVYADITLETVALDAPNDEAVLSQMLQLNAQQRSVLFQNRTSLSFSDCFTRTVTQHNHWCTYTSTTECKQTVEEHSVLLTEVLSVWPT
jgi:hypothetical protein